jgi:hypothetical protein
MVPNREGDEVIGIEDSLLRDSETRKEITEFERRLFVNPMSVFEPRPKCILHVFPNDQSVRHFKCSQRMIVSK